jgi:2-keto-4-pentenoate hydratase/2-oxohepta-3-ene-1,7-dioic acid hydratase in catechol pathway
MRFVRTIEGRTGLLLAGSEPERVVDVAARMDGLARTDASAALAIADTLLVDREQSWVRMISDWDAVRGAFAALLAAAERGLGGVAVRALDDVRLGPPLPSEASRVFAVGANFAPHAAQSDAAIAGTHDAEHREAAIVKAKRAGVPPWGFSLLPGTFIGTGAAISPPPATEKLDYEAEVAVIFRAGGSRRGLDVRPWGVTAWNDVSIRDPHLGLGVKVDHGPMTWTLQKNFDTSNPCGPCVVVDEGIDVNDVAFSMYVNGELRQSGTTADMVYSFDEVVAHLSSYLTMRSGDIVVSGTSAGTALEQGIDGPYLQDRDEAVVEVQGVGVLRNPVVMQRAAGDVAPPVKEEVR